MKSKKLQLLDYFNRLDVGGKELFFEEVLADAVEKALHLTGSARDQFVNANLARYWNAYKRMEQDDLSERGLEPIFEVTNNNPIKVKCYLREQHKLHGNKKHLMLQSRYNILKEIDSLSSRQYEGLAGVVCKLLGAENIHLTPPGNEAGIDFVATFRFNKDSHFLFGNNGPIRIIGQSKNYNQPIQVDKVKEFNSTLLDVYHLTAKTRNILPPWFHLSRGPIIGWIICHSGSQSGATDRAREYGIIVSDSKDLAELIASSRKYGITHVISDRYKDLKPAIAKALV